MNEYIPSILVSLSVVGNITTNTELANPEPLLLKEIQGKFLQASGHSVFVIWLMHNGEVQILHGIASRVYVECKKNKGQTHRNREEKSGCQGAGETESLVKAMNLQLSGE